MHRLTYLLIFLVAGIPDFFTQVSYNAAKIYSLRKVVPTYTGSAITMRRACDNATANIGFSSCGDLDTVSLKAFALAAPLNALSAASAASFSLRKLNCSYAGNCIRIRSTAAGSPTTDIGFTVNGDLDTVAMNTFIVNNSAFVTIWYDQSGNGRNASQATTANQPRIMNAGVIEYQNNRPAIRFQDITDGLQTVGYNAYNTACCFNGVAKVSANLGGAYNNFLSKTGIAPNNNIPSPLDIYYNVGGNSMNLYVGNGVNPYSFAPSQNFNAAQPLGIWTFCSEISASTASLNGTSILAAGAVATFSDRGQPLNIGKRNDGVTGLNGWIQEIVTFGVIPSSTDIRYLQWTQSIYYSISGPSIIAYPTNAPDAFVTTWFDQSGNGTNASQATAGNQPQIMDAGAFINNNARPAISFNGTSQTFTAATHSTAFNNTVGGFLSVIGKNNGVVAFQTFAQQGRNATPWWGIWANNNNPAKWSGRFSNGAGTMVSATNSSVYAIADLMQTPSTSSQFYVNGTLINSATTANSSNSQIFTIGLSNTTEYLNGSIAEVQLFALNMKNTRRKLIESNQAANYSITIASAIYTPPSATTYNRFVVGVGRESTTDSVAGTRSTAGMGFKIGTAGTDFLKNNGDYITAGIGCPMSALSTTANCPATVLERWLNDWYINKTDVGGNNGTLQIYFDFNDNGVTVSPGAATNYELLYRSTTSGNYTIVAGTTKTVVGDQVLFSVSGANITTNYYYTLGTKNITASPLPVELLRFEAQKINNQVRLDWSTASEKNSKEFIVQRLVNDIDFEKIGEPVKAAGYSTDKKNYELFDPSPKAGINYYRLKQIDFDNTFSYSKIEFVEFTQELPPTIFPNPGDGTYTVSNAKGYDKISVHNLLGQIVFSEEISNGNIELLDLTSLQNGLYFVILSNTHDTNQTSFKVVKR